MPNIDFSKAFGRGEDFDDLVEKKDELILAPNYDAIKPNAQAGGAIAMDKQLGRPVEMSIEDDEVFVLPTGTDAIPNDPMKPKVIVPTFDNYLERFKYEPEGMEKDIEGDVLVLPPERKKLPKEKVLIKMDRNIGRYDNVKKESNVDLVDIALDDGEFKGIDLVDINKAFKANLPH